MSERFWTKEAAKYAATVGRTMRPRKGVMAVEGRADVLCLFAPYLDQVRIKQQLEDAGIGILGVGTSMFLPGESVFVMIVKSSDGAQLSAILDASTGKKKE